MPSTEPRKYISSTFHFLCREVSWGTMYFAHLCGVVLCSPCLHQTESSAAKNSQCIPLQNPVNQQAKHMYQTGEVGCKWRRDINEGRNQSRPFTGRDLSSYLSFWEVTSSGIIWTLGISTLWSNFTGCDFLCILAIDYTFLNVLWQGFFFPRRGETLGFDEFWGAQVACVTTVFSSLPLSPFPHPLPLLPLSPLPLPPLPSPHPIPLPPLNTTHSARGLWILQKAPFLPVSLRR